MADDDSGPGANARLSFTPTTTGTYYLDAGSYQGTADKGLGPLSTTGSYRLTVVAQDPVPELAFEEQAGTYDEMAYYLQQGFWHDGQIPGFAAVRDADNIVTVHIAGLSSTVAQRLARWGLQAYEAVINVRFKIVDDATAAYMVFQDNEEGNFATGFGTAQVKVNIEADQHGGRSGQLLGSLFRIYLHEIGHAMGLGHPGSYPATGMMPTIGTIAIS